MIYKSKQQEKKNSFQVVFKFLVLQKQGGIDLNNFNIQVVEKKIT